tara:strand:- start:24 stop:230 length:207 start_codon:yes stop_codon:yes gene_type:complete
VVAVAEHMEEVVVERLLAVAELAVKDVALLVQVEQVQMEQLIQVAAVVALAQDMALLALVEQADQVSL